MYKTIIIVVMVSALVYIINKFNHLMHELNVKLDTLSDKLTEATKQKERAVAREKQSTAPTGAGYQSYACNRKKFTTEMNAARSEARGEWEAKNKLSNASTAPTGAVITPATTSQPVRKVD